MSATEIPRLWIVRDPQPIANYIRPMRRDYNHLADLISGNWPRPSGVVVDARSPELILNLLNACHAASVEVVLDPLSVELSTPGGFAKSGVRDLTWALAKYHRAEDFSDVIRQHTAQEIAETAVHMGATAVLAPTHVLETSVSGWLPVDVDLVVRLRAALDGCGGRGISIYYPLIARLQTLLSSSAALRTYLERLAGDEVIDALWLRAVCYDAHSARSTQIRRYVEVARSMHALKVPVVAERTGTFGVALAAFGIVGGAESGVFAGERYDIRHLTKPQKHSGRGGPSMRVYLPSIGAFLNRAKAEAFLKAPGIRNWFVCQERCCARGVNDMVREPRRHFIVSRALELERLGSVPVEIRASHYLESWLRPATDRATKAALVEPQLVRNRERLDHWRATFGEILERDNALRPTYSSVPNRERRSRNI